LTNDDGIKALGLKTLYEAVKSLGEVWVVAPAEEQSGSGHSFSPRKRIRVTRLAPHRYKVYGTPTDCVLLAHHAFMRSPIDLVISGINHGPNLGDDVTYSGTVAAAIEGTILGIPSVAVSLVNKNINRDLARRFVYDLIYLILKLKPLNHTFLNINIPAEPVQGIRITKLGKRIYRDAARRHLTPKGTVYYTIDGKLDCRQDKGTDCEAIAQAFISITPLHLDLTDYKEMSQLTHLMTGLKV
jgi:5'-nucleotidase